MFIIVEASGLAWKEDHLANVAKKEKKKRNIILGLLSFRENEQWRYITQQGHFDDEKRQDLSDSAQQVIDWLIDWSIASFIRFAVINQSSMPRQKKSWVFTSWEK